MNFRLTLSSGYAYWRGALVYAILWYEKGLRMKGLIMSIRKTGIIFYTVLFTVFILLTGCSNKDNETDPNKTTAEMTISQDPGGDGVTVSTDNTTQGINESTTQSASTVQEQDDESDGDDIFTFALIGSVDSLDPGWTGGTLSTLVLSNLGEGLVRYDNEGTLVPGAALSWDISEEGTVYTFTLRDNLKWSDGSALTARDFVYAWRRVLNQEFGSHSAHTMYPYIKNGEAYFNGDAQWEDVGVTAINDKTLEVTLSSPTPYILQLMATCTYYPVSEKAVLAAAGSSFVSIQPQGGSWASNPNTFVGNGAYKLAEFTNDTQILIEKNEHYRNADAVTISEIIFPISQIPQTALDLFESGKADGVGGIPPGIGTGLPTDVDDFHSIPAFSTSYALFNLKESALLDPRVRKALSQTIDRSVLVETTLPANSEPATAYIAPGFIIDGEDFRAVGGSYDLSPHGELIDTRILMAEAGYPNGAGFPELEIIYYANGSEQIAAASIQAMWQDILGITMTVTGLEWADFSERVQNQEYDICLITDIGETLHPMSLLKNFHSKDATIRTTWNNTEYNQLIEELRSETDPAASLEKMHQAEDLLMNACVIAPLYHGTTPILMAPSIKNWSVTANHYAMFEQIIKER